MMKKNFLLLTAVLLCWCGSAFAWGKSGHDAIAYIAERHLTPKAKKNIEKYLDGRSIVSTLRGWTRTVTPRLIR